MIYLKLLLGQLMSMICVVTVFATDVTHFGAKGDGIADDTEAIETAAKNAADGLLVFPKGTYKITRIIEIPLAALGTLSISGNHGSAAIVMHGEGPAIRFLGTHEKGSALPATLSPSVWEKERMPTIEGIEIRGAHPHANGLEFRNTFQPVIRGVLIRNVHHGIHLTSRNRNVLIESSHIYHCSGIGVFLDAVNIHQINIGNSHISYCRQGGIKVAKSEIRNFQITGNDIEYNCDPQAGPVADVWIDVSEGGSVREGTITGNTIQAIQSPNGANIRFTGAAGNPDKIGLWSITGNHISNQDINIDLQFTRGIAISGNSFIRAYDRHMVIEDSKNIVVNANVFDHNPDYFTPDVVATGGVLMQRSDQILFSQNVLEGIAYGSAVDGAAIMIKDCQSVDLSGLQIINPTFRAIEIDGCNQFSITDSRITVANSSSFVTAIALKNTNTNYKIKDNILPVGKGKTGLSSLSKSELKNNIIQK